MHTTSGQKRHTIQPRDRYRAADRIIRYEIRPAHCLAFVSEVDPFNFIAVFDRRIMAGAQAARFYARVTELLADAETMLTDPADRSSG